MSSLEEDIMIKLKISDNFIDSQIVFKLIQMYNLHGSEVDLDIYLKLVEILSYTTDHQSRSAIMKYEQQNQDGHSIINTCMAMVEGFVKNNDFEYFKYILSITSNLLALDEKYIQTLF